MIFTWFLIGLNLSDPSNQISEHNNKRNLSLSSQDGLKISTQKYKKNVLTENVYREILKTIENQPAQWANSFWIAKDQGPQDWLQQCSETVPNIHNPHTCVPLAGHLKKTYGVNQLRRDMYVRARVIRQRPAQCIGAFFDSSFKQGRAAFGWIVYASENRENFLDTFQEPSNH